MEAKEYDRNYYIGKDSNYIFGYQHLRWKIFWGRRLKILKKVISSGTVLDTGCAFGFFIKMVERNFQVYGLDISEYATQKAKDIVSKPERIKCYDINKGIPFERRFDVITAFDFFEHMEDPVTIFNFIDKSLKPNGYFYLELPFSKTVINRDIGHYYRPMKIWLHFLSQAGFKPLWIRTYYTVGLRFIMIPTRKFSNYCSIIAKRKDESEQNG